MGRPHKEREVCEQAATLHGPASKAQGRLTFKQPGAVLHRIA